MPPQSDINNSYTKQPLLNPKSSMAITYKSRKTKSKEEDKWPTIKCVIVGDGAVGKTSLAVSYSNDTFPTEYVPTAFDNYNVIVQVDGEPIRVQLCDTAGQDELDPLRSLCYPDTDVFMLCFSVVKPSSFQSAATRWADELSTLGASIILVGTQADLFHDPHTLQMLRHKGQSPVPPAHARDLAKRLNAPYIETSALTCSQLKEAFDQAIMAALKRKNCRKKKSLWKKLCCIR